VGWNDCETKKEEDVKMPKAPKMKKRYVVLYGKDGVSKEFRKPTTAKKLARKIENKYGGVEVDEVRYHKGNWQSQGTYWKPKEMK